MENQSSTADFQFDLLFYLNSTKNIARDSGLGQASILLVSDCVGATILGFISYVTYRTIDIGHPQFAILFHDLIVGLSANVFCVLLSLDNFVFSTGNIIKQWSIAYNLLCILALQFHYCAWLVVSILRYLMLRKDGFSIDRVKLAATLSPYLTLMCQYFLVALIVLPTAFAIGIHRHLVQFIFYSSCLIPILISMGFYLALKCKFNQNNIDDLDIVSEVVVVDHSQAGSNSDFGGNFESNPGQILEIYPDIQIPAPPPNIREQMPSSMENKILKEQRQKEDRAVISALKTNLILSTVVASLMLISVYPSSSEKRLALAFVGSVSKTILPVVTALMNFQKVRDGLRQIQHIFTIS